MSNWIMQVSNLITLYKVAEQFLFHLLFHLIDNFFFIQDQALQQLLHLVLTQQLYITLQQKKLMLKSTQLTYFWVSLIFFHVKMVFCSDLLWEKIVLVIEKKLLTFETEGWEFAKFLRSLEQFIQTVNGQNNFW